MRLIDLSHPIEAGMPVYPGDVPTNLVPERFLRQDGYNAYTLHSAMHAGTHVDAPMHLLAESGFVSDLPLQRFCGPGFLLEGLNDPREIPQSSCVLIHTGYDAHYGQADYYTAQPEMDMPLCERILAAHPRCVGLDMASPDLPPFAVHKRLLAAGVPIVENLTNLAALRGLSFDFFAFPLKIHAEASLVRAAALVRD